MRNPLFYNDITILNSETHKGLRLREEGLRYGFARTAHLIPALVEEFSAAAMDLPIAFLGGAKQPSPVFVAGLAPGNNLFIDVQGGWSGGYVPAYLRRYPFIIGEATADSDANSDPDSPSSVLCIDQSFDGLDTETGKPLFDDEGGPAEVTTAALDLSERYRLGAARSDAFCAKLLDLNLFRPVTLEVKRPVGQSIVVHGLLTIEVAAFDALSDEVFLELRRLGYLQPIYAHIESLRALDRLSERLDKQEKDVVAA